MKHISTVGIAVAAIAALPATGYAKYDVAVHGSVQADIAVVEDDKDIHTPPYDHRFLFNTYADVNLASKYVDAGLRAEFMKWPIPGYEPDFAGWGLSNFYVKGKYKGFELTGGDFYEQFGSGFILRTYEERALGIDNAIRGARLNVTAVKGLKLTALGGVQRVYWDWSKRNQVYGANAEVYFENYIPKIAEYNATWMVGASWVMKHEDDRIEDLPTVTDPATKTDYSLKVPKFVHAFDVRTTFQKGPWSLLGEYAWKGQDPSYDNDYTYSHGDAIMLSGAYSKKGISAQIQAKRSRNMSFRTQRYRSGLGAFINHMPAFTYTHTYSLPALYPYQTQYGPGEWAFQGSFTYNFKKHTPLGGRYGTKLTLNASYVGGLVYGNPPEEPFGTIMGTDGYNIQSASATAFPFFKIGQTNYWDFNIQVEKKFTPQFQATFMYMNQTLNNKVVPIVETDEKYIRSNILVVDGKYKFNRKFTLRAELQYLFTRQDQKDWAYGLLEFSWSPYLMVYVSDMWNTGTTGTHYYMAGVTGIYRSNRLGISYGRTRAGYNCSGGLCRPVPAMHGLQVNYSYNF